MKLFLLENKTIKGYDTFDSMIVAARSAQQAVLIHPHGVRHNIFKSSQEEFQRTNIDRVWCDSEDVIVKEIAKESKFMYPQIVLTSFNAG